MGLDHHLVKFIQDFLLVLWVLAESEDQVLGGDTGCLRTGKEESKNFINDAPSAVFEMFIDQENGQEVTCFSKLRIFLDCFTPLIDDLRAEVTKSLRVTRLISFKRRKVVRSEEGEEDDVRGRDSADQVTEGEAEAERKCLFAADPTLPEIDRSFGTIDSECAGKKDTRVHEANFLHDIDLSSGACR